MNAAIELTLVSKRYRLGLTRTSLPALASDWCRGVVGRTPMHAGPKEELWALRDVSFELGKGQSLALIGRNGAGKTTVLRLLANITKPSSGTIKTKGQLSALIELGAGFHPDLTGRENIYLNGAILGLKRKEIERQFDEIVAFSELERFVDTPVKRYSSGMTVRLGFAVASCIRPDILLVDEVLAVGDAPFQQKCMTRIRSLLSTGTCLVFVSHNLYLVRAVCEAAIYLDGGCVRHRGPTMEVITAYEQDLHRERARKFEAKEDDSDDIGSDDIEIEKVELLRADGSSADVYSNREAVQVRIHYHAYRTIGKVQAAVLVRRSDGLTCCMMRTQLDDFNLCVARGKGTVSVEMEPLQVISGTYCAEAWFLDEADCRSLTPGGGRSDWFLVKGLALSYAETSGVFQPNTRWSHLRQEPSVAGDGRGTGGAG